MATFKAVILKGKNDVKRNGTTNIKIRVTHNGKNFYLKTNVFVLPHFFNNLKGKITKGQDKNFLNSIIASQLYKYQMMALKIDEKIDYFSVSKLKDILLERSQNKLSKIDLIVFSKEYISQKMPEGTKRSFRTFINSIQRFNGPTLPVLDINLRFIKSYETYLSDTGVKNGIHTYMRIFQSLFIRCQEHYNDELNDSIIIPFNPFTKYKAPKPKLKTKEHYLTTNELKALINYKS